MPASTVPFHDILSSLTLPHKLYYAPTDQSVVSATNISLNLLSFPLDTLDFYRDNAARSDAFAILVEFSARWLERQTQPSRFPTGFGIDLQHARQVQQTIDACRRNGEEEGRRRHSGEAGMQAVVYAVIATAVNAVLASDMFPTGIRFYWRCVGTGPGGKPDLELVCEWRDPQSNVRYKILAVWELKTDKTVTDTVRNGIDRLTEAGGPAYITKTGRVQPAAEEGNLTERENRDRIIKQCVGETLSRRVRLCLLSNWNSLTLFRTNAQCTQTGIMPYLSASSSFNQTQRTHSIFSFILGATLLAIREQLPQFEHATWNRPSTPVPGANPDDDEEEEAEEELERRSERGEETVGPRSDRGGVHGLGQEASSGDDAPMELGARCGLSDHPMRTGGDEGSSGDVLDGGRGRFEGDGSPACRGEDRGTGVYPPAHLPAHGTTNGEGARSDRFRSSINLVDPSTDPAHTIGQDPYRAPAPGKSQVHTEIFPPSPPHSDPSDSPPSKRIKAVRVLQAPQHRLHLNGTYASAPSAEKESVQPKNIRNLRIGSGRPAPEHTEEEAEEKERDMGTNSRIAVRNGLPTPEHSPEARVVTLARVGPALFSLVTISQTSDTGESPFGKQIRKSQIFHGPYSLTSDELPLIAVSQNTPVSPQQVAAQPLFNLLQGEHRVTGAQWKVHDALIDFRHTDPRKLSPTRSGAVTSLVANLEAHRLSVKTQRVMVKLSNISSFPPDTSHDNPYWRTVLSASEVRRGIATEFLVHASLGELQSVVVPRYFGLFASLVPRRETDINDRSSEDQLDESGVSAVTVGDTLDHEVAPTALDQVWCALVEDAGQLMAEHHKMDPRIRNKIFSLYAQLHSHGIIHNDVAWRHILAPLPESLGNIDLPADRESYEDNNDQMTAAQHAEGGTMEMLEPVDLAKIRLIDFNNAISRYHLDTATNGLGTSTDSTGGSLGVMPEIQFPTDPSVTASCNQQVPLATHPARQEVYGQADWTEMCAAEMHRVRIMLSEP